MLKIKIIQILIMLPLFALAGNVHSNQLETKKQAVFIRSIIDQVSGFRNEKELRVGILDNSQLFESFQELSLPKQSFQKKITPINYSSLKAINDIDVLFVHSSSNYPINQLLDFVHNKRILLITEDYEYQKYIINILSAQGCYYVDLNEFKLNNSGFVASDNLKKNTIKSEEEWNALTVKKIPDFHEKLSLLEEEQKRLTQVKETLLEEKIRIQNREINNLNKLQEKNNQIKNEQTLSSEFKDQIKKEQELALAFKNQIKELEEEYVKKLSQLKDLEVQHKNQEQLVVNKQKELDSQTALIDQQASILGKKTKEIEDQRKFSFLLMGIVGLSAILVFFIFLSRKKEKRFVAQLEKQNKEIEKTSIKLQRQNKELKQFAYIASHDLQEPLHTVSSFADFMIEDYANKLDESGVQYLHFMKQGCKRMSNLITALLDYSKIGKERELVTIESGKVINTIIEDFNSLINKTNTRIICNEMPVIQGYEVELRLLFQNLISNAIKFRKPNVSPEIYIEGKKIPPVGEYLDCWQFSVKDNGIGIAKDNHHKIFRIFKRLHNLEEYQGTGIGLAHCEKIVTLHHGDIWVESEPDKGSTFHFTIQLNKKKAIAA